MEVIKEVTKVILSRKEAKLVVETFGKLTPAFMDEKHMRRRAIEMMCKNLGDAIATEDRHNA